MSATETDRFVHVAFEVVPGNVETDEDLRELGRYVMELARDEMKWEDKRSKEEHDGRQTEGT